MFFKKIQLRIVKEKLANVPLDFDTILNEEILSLDASLLELLANSDDMSGECLVVVGGYIDICCCLVVVGLDIH